MSHPKILYFDSMIQDEAADAYFKGFARAIVKTPIGAQADLKRVRFFGRSMLRPAHIERLIALEGASAVVFSGSEKNTTDREDPWVVEFIESLRRTLHADDPESLGPGFSVLGICFGHQAIAAAFGGETCRFERQVGMRPMKFLSLAKELEPWASAWRSASEAGVASNEARVPVYHSDHVVRVPRDFQLLLSSDYCDVQAMSHKLWPILGVQFHPEACSALKDRAKPDPAWDNTSAKDLDAHWGSTFLEKWLNWAIR